MAFCLPRAERPDGFSGETYRNMSLLFMKSYKRNTHATSYGRLTDWVFGGNETSHVESRRCRSQSRQLGIFRNGKAIRRPADCGVTHTAWDLYQAFSFERGGCASDAHVQSAPTSLWPSQTP